MSNGLTQKLTNEITSFRRISQNQEQDNVQQKQPVSSTNSHLVTPHLSPQDTNFTQEQSLILFSVWSPMPNDTLGNRKDDTNFDEAINHRQDLEEFHLPCA